MSYGRHLVTSKWWAFMRMLARLMPYVTEYPALSLSASMRSQYCLWLPASLSTNWSAWNCIKEQNFVMSKWNMLNLYVVLSTFSPSLFPVNTEAPLANKKRTFSLMSLVVAIHILHLQSANPSLSLHCKRGIVITTECLLLQIQMSEQNTLLCGGELHDNLFLILSQLSSTLSYHLSN